MFGNTKGWVIAAVVAVLWTAGVSILWAGGRLTPGTGLAESAAVTQPIRLPAGDPVEVVAGGAGRDDLRRVLRLAGRERNQLERFLSRPAPDARQAIDTMLDMAGSAAAKGVDRPLAGVEADTIAYPTPQSRVELRQLTQVVEALNLRSALAEKQGDADLARRDAEAAYRIGRAMAEERLVLAELRAGLQAMATAARGLDPASPVPAEVSTLFAELQPVERALTSVDTRVVAEHAGDARAILAGEGEPMWQREAALALGRQKFNAAKLADQRDAGEVVKLLAAETDDELLRHAARAADGLTLDTYRRMK